MNPWDAIDPRDDIGWTHPAEKELTPEELEWMRRQVDIAEFETDSDPGDENGS